MSDITFKLVPNDPRNTELISSQGHVAYKCVTTKHEAGTYSHVNDSSGKEIANLQWNTGYPDKVQLGDEKLVSVAEWMKKSSIPFSDYLTFTDKQGRKYHWKGTSASHHLKLYSEEDHYHTPIAQYEEELVAGSGEKDGHLILTARATEIQDLVVTSFLFLEKQKRFPRKNNGIDSGWVALGGAGALGQLAAGLAPSM